MSLAQTNPADVRWRHPCRWYFAYGSNMNRQRVTQRGLSYDKVLAGWMPGFGLRFNKQSREHPDCGHANLVYAPNEVAEGVLYRLTDDSMIWRMDPFEKAPINYSRECVEVQTANGPVVSWVYFANRAVIKSGLCPSRDYLGHLLAGKSMLSPEYAARLEAQSVSGDVHGGRDAAATVAAAVNPPEASGD